MFLRKTRAHLPHRKIQTEDSMENKQNVLGKGLSAIFTEKNVDVEGIENTGRVSSVIPLDKINANPFQPREEFDDQRLRELADSIREKGVIQPVTVRKDGEGFLLISGERRVRAARLAGLTEIPAYLYSHASAQSDEGLLELAIIENIQREDLNPMELSDSYKKLADMFKLTQEQIAAKVAKQRSTVANFLRLQNLPVEIKHSLRKNEITEAHARILLSVESEDDMLLLWKRILAENLTVRSLERAAEPSAKKKRTKKVKLGEIYDPHIQGIEDKLRRYFGTKVTISRKSKHSGEVRIEYFSNDDLERIVDKCS